MREFDEPAVIILKHQNPCGSANGKDIVEAFDRAFACDTKSAFGGIIAANRTVTTEMVEHIQANKLFVEVLIAPDFEQGALKLLAEKPNLRVLKTGGIDPLGAEPGSAPWTAACAGAGRGRCGRGSRHTFTVPTKRKPTDKEMDDLLFAWKVVKGVKSNAILVAKDHAGIGMGPGQPNRVDSALIACNRAGEACTGAVVASDAFFPFRDNVDTLAEHGITAIIQPGGSIRAIRRASMRPTNTASPWCSPAIAISATRLTLPTGTAIPCGVRCRFPGHAVCGMPPCCVSDRLLKGVPAWIPVPAIRS